MKDLDFKRIGIRPGEALFPSIYEPHPGFGQAEPKFGLSIPGKYFQEHFKSHPLIHSLPWKRISGKKIAYCRASSKLKPEVKTDNVPYVVGKFYEAQALNRNPDDIFRHNELIIEVALFEYTLPTTHLIRTYDGEGEPTTRVAATLKSVRIM